MLASLAAVVLLAGPVADPALADVAFMGGHWVDAGADSLSEEIWTAPSGDSMLGSWRYVAKGKAQIYEMLAITAEPGGLVMRLRHFDPALVAREEKDRPVVLKLVSHAAGEAVFEGQAATGPSGLVRLTYRARGSDGLVGILEKQGRREEFAFTRAAAAKP